MQMNIIQLINKGKVGDHLRSRGGDRFKYNRYAFVKTKKDTICVYTAHTWSTLNKNVQSEVHKPIATLTEDCITFKLERGAYNNQYAVWEMAGFLSLNLLHNCYVRHSQGQLLIHVGNGTMNGKDITPFGIMKFDWSGNLMSTIPKHAIKTYNTWDRKVKDQRNAASRTRYAQNKVERTFKKHRENGTLDQWDPKEVFKLKNAQVRQQAIEVLGLDKILKDCPTVVIDKDTIDGRPYELIEIELPAMSNWRPHWGNDTMGAKKCLYLKMTNPSTGEYHLEGVARKSDNTWDYIPEETVKGALAWRDGENPTKQFNGNIKNEDWKYIRPITIT